MKLICKQVIEMDAVFEGVQVKLYRYNFEYTAGATKFEATVQTPMQERWKVGDTVNLKLG